jgi:hypothetical protein
MTEALLTENLIMDLVEVFKMTNEMFSKLFVQIRDCQTIEDLDKLREDIVVQCRKHPEYFKMLQTVFIKKKNQIKYGPTTS